MTLLRSVMYLLFMSVSTVVYAVPISLFGWILPYRWTAKAGQHWGRINLWALKYICRLSYQIQGIENLPSANCIILCKHQSAWETIALRAILPPEHTWVLKKELLWIPFFGWALAVFKPIAIQRNSIRRTMRQLLTEGKHWLDQGRWIVIFPEGTRVAPGQKIRYGQGGAVLAEKTGYPIVPIAHNAGIFWGRRDIRKYAGKIDMIIGKPITPNGFSASEISQKIERWIEHTVDALPQKRN